MSGGFVCMEQLQSLQAALLQFTQEANAERMSFQNAYNAYMQSFEAKRVEVESELERASRALSACESYRGPHGERRNCSSEEARFERAYRRYKKVVALIEEAQSCITDYESQVDGLHNEMQALQEKGNPFLNNLMEKVSRWANS